MEFAFEVLNPNFFPVTLPTVGGVQLAIVSVTDVEQGFGNTPAWFRSFISGLLPGNIQAPFQVIDAQLQRLEAPGREISVEMLDQIPVIRRLGASSFNPKIGAERRNGTRFIWDFRNELFECIAAGDYAAIAWMTTPIGVYSTGWMRFVVF